MKTLIKLILVVLVILVGGCSQIDQAPQDNRVTIAESGILL